MKWHVKLSVILGLALVAMVTVSKAEASAFCPPGGPGAPGYCDNIPHKDKKVSSSPNPIASKQRIGKSSR
jgi:hypothetical protein